MSNKMKSDRPIILFLEIGEDKMNRKLLKIAKSLKKCGCECIEIVFCPASMKERYHLPYLSDEFGGPLYGEKAIHDFARYKMNEKKLESEMA